MKAMYRIGAFLLAIALVFSCAPAAFAAGHPFKDVSGGDWYAEYVDYVYENNLMNGTSETTFSPNAAMTRGMTVTVLHRIAGSPEATSANPFTDVSDDTWYNEAVSWAVEENITSGVSDARFAPNENVTREQLVTFLYRYALSMDMEMGAASLEGYSDYFIVSDYAKPAFGWAVYAGIISGTDASHLSPQADATRAQCATILTRFDQWIGGTKEVLPDVTEPEETEPTETVEPSVPEVTTPVDSEWPEDGYIDPSIEVELGINARGHNSYKNNDLMLRVTDRRDWGDPPSIAISEEGYFKIVYYKEDGTRVKVTLCPVEGYVSCCTIFEDGSYKTGLLGYFDD